MTSGIESKLQVLASFASGRTSGEKMAKLQAPFSYPCLGSIIGNMNADVRFKLAGRLGTFLKTEKEIPLKLDKLETENYGIKTNETEYHIGVSRFDLENGKLKPFMFSGRPFLFYYNVDKYGIIPSAEQIIEKTLEEKEEDEKWLLEYETKRVDQMIRDPERFDEFEMKRLPLYQDRMTYRTKDIAKYELKRRNLEPTYKYFLHFSIKRGNEEKTENVEFNQNLRKAQEYMMSKIFSGRCKINGNKWTILSPAVDRMGFNFSFDPLLLPQDTKLIVKHLDSLQLDKPLEVLRPLLDPSCLPLKSVRIYSPEVKDHEFLSKDVKKIVIESVESVPRMLQMPYKRVQFERIAQWWREVAPEISRQPTSALLALPELANAWRDSKREVGTHYSFECNEDEYFDRMRVFRNEPGAVQGVVPDPRTNIKKACVINPLDEKTEIIVFGSFVPVENRIRKDDDFLIELMVQRKGHATPL